MNNVGLKLNFKNCFAVSSNGKSGGLALLWDSDIRVSISSFSNHHIDAEVDNEDGNHMRCTGVYGHPEKSQKKYTWTLLRRLAGLSLSPWLCFGDFNEILNLDEKKGGIEREADMISEFRKVIQECDLKDLGCSWYPFTWSNRRYGPHFIEERLDRFLGSIEWTQRFQDDAAKNLVSWCSDHSPVMLDVIGRGNGGQNHRRTLSRVHYEDFWSTYDECRGIIQRNWAEIGSWSGSNTVQLFQKTSKNSLAELMLWSKRAFGDSKKKLEKLRNRLEELQGHNRQYVKGEEVKSIKRKIHHLVLNEEIYWKQRSRADWLAEGDKNTRYFHSKASSRKRKNKIWGVEDTQAMEDKS
ncbi:hypothetical protein AB3S75_003870 [Citrus x aurantiifolia]